MNIIKTITKTVIPTILLLSLPACLHEDELNLLYEGYTPSKIGDGWEISTPEAENMDPEIFDQLYRDISISTKYPTIRSLLIVRNGRLVGESYFKDRSDRDQLHNIMSATKSVTSILTGIAIDKGLIDSKESSVYSYLKKYFDDDQRKRSISIHQVLTMETGLDFNNDIHTRELLSGKINSLKYVLGKELIFAPGTDWYYGDGNPQLLSGIIQMASGISLAAFAEKYLFHPIGINQYYWEVHSDGLNFGAVGLWLTPRDMAKIGLLMANKGSWNGISILSEEWVNLSTQKQSAHQDYGYYWYPIEDKVFYAEGHGGQLIWVYPGKNLVVVITSDSYAKAWNLSVGYGDIFNRILNSLR